MVGGALVGVGIRGSVRVLSAAAASTQPQRDPLGGGFTRAFVLADGLSAIAVQRHAPPFLRACLDRLTGWETGPVVIATQARVA